MKLPKTVTEVQRLTSCIVSLSRFMSKSTAKCSTFFLVLQVNFKWDVEAEEVFIQLKKYLAEIPKLVSPLLGETFFLYISVPDYSLSVVLVAESEKQQMPIYYVIEERLEGEEPVVVKKPELAPKPLEGEFVPEPHRMIQSITLT